MSNPSVLHYSISGGKFIVFLVDLYAQSSTQAGTEMSKILFRALVLLFEFCCYRIFSFQVLWHNIKFLSPIVPTLNWWYTTNIIQRKDVKTLGLILIECQIQIIWRESHITKKDKPVPLY